MGTKENKERKKKKDAARTKAKQLNALKNCKIFEDLDEATRNKVVDKMELEVYNSGVDICKQGDVANFLYLILEGSCKVVVNRKKVAVLKELSVFGEGALFAIDGVAKRGGTVTAISDVQLLGLTKDNFDLLVKSGALDEKCIKKLNQMMVDRTKENKKPKKKNPSFWDKGEKEIEIKMKKAEKNEVLYGKKKEKNDRDKKVAATKMQALHRGKSARKEVEQIKEEKDQHNAATKMQALHRGKSTRKETELRKQKINNEMDDTETVIAETILKSSESSLIQPLPPSSPSPKKKNPKKKHHKKKRKIPTPPPIPDEAELQSFSKEPNPPRNESRRIERVRTPSPDQTSSSDQSPSSYPESISSHVEFQDRFQKDIESRARRAEMREKEANMSIQQKDPEATFKPNLSQTRNANSKRFQLRETKRRSNNNNNNNNNNNKQQKNTIRKNWLKDEEEDVDNGYDDDSDGVRKEGWDNYNGQYDRNNNRNPVQQQHTQQQQQQRHSPNKNNNNK